MITEEIKEVIACFDIKINAVIFVSRHFNFQHRHHFFIDIDAHNALHIGFSTVTHKTLQFWIPPQRRPTDKKTEFIVFIGQAQSPIFHFSDYFGVVFIVFYKF